MYDLSYTTRFRAQISKQPGREAQVRAALERLRCFEPNTAAHSQRVGKIAGFIARELGLSDLEVALVSASGELHDIGKSEISLEYILKPSTLSEAEYLEVKRHPELGANLVYACPELLELIPGILYHHERVDGRGYPFGLRGEEIPLIARIIAVADTYDAMTSDRAYRSALSSTQALNELKAHVDCQFDACVVAAALNALPKNVSWV